MVLASFLLWKTGAGLDLPLLAANAAVKDKKRFEYREARFTPRDGRMTRVGSVRWVRAAVSWFAVGLVLIERAAQENATKKYSETALSKRNRNVLTRISPGTMLILR